MYAIIATGGKQYRVSQGDVIYVEKLNEEVGAEVTFPVLMLGGDTVEVGNPVLAGASVSGIVWCRIMSPRVGIAEECEFAVFQEGISHFCAFEEEVAAPPFEIQ